MEVGGYKTTTMKHDTLFAIANAVANHYDIEIKDLFKDTRMRDIADKRSVFFYFAYKYSGVILKDIGRFCLLYGREAPYNHATVIHSFRKITELKEFNKKIAIDVDVLESHIVLNIVTEKKRVADSFYKRQEIIRDLYEEKDIGYIDAVYTLLKIMNSDRNEGRVKQSIEFYQKMYDERVHKTT